MNVSPDVVFCAVSYCTVDAVTDTVSEVDVPIVSAFSFSLVLLLTLALFLSDVLSVAMELVFESDLLCLFALSVMFAVSFVPGLLSSTDSVVVLDLSFASEFTFSLVLSSMSDVVFSSENDVVP